MHTNCLLFLALAYTLFTPVNALDIPSLRKKSFGMAHTLFTPVNTLENFEVAKLKEFLEEQWAEEADRLERVIRFTQQNHNEIGPVARAARWCLAAQFEEIPDEPWAERRERVRRFTQQGEEQCKKKLKKSLE